MQVSRQFLTANLRGYRNLYVVQAIVDLGEILMSIVNLCLGDVALATTSEIIKHANQRGIALKANGASTEDT